jgi:hypothetical protein
VRKRWVITDISHLEKEQIKEERGTPLCGESINIFEFVQIIDKLSIESLDKFISLNELLNSCVN